MILDCYCGCVEDVGMVSQQEGTKIGEGGGYSAWMCHQSLASTTT